LEEKELLLPLEFILLISIAFLLSFGETSSWAIQDNTIHHEVQKLQEESLKKIETILNDKSFHDIVLGLNGKNSCSTTKKCQLTVQPESHPSLVPTDIDEAGDLYVFVSFSLGEKALLNLAREAKRYGVTLVLRGFKACPHESGEPGKINYKKTVQALQKIIQKTGQGFVIDPELFTLFSIQVIPTYVLTKPFQLRAEERTQTPIHDRMQGHVSTHYALETFAKEGDLKEEALSLLMTRETKE
jgi:type-F conjugative transfer system pilin assembly protein TrbC